MSQTFCLWSRKGKVHMMVVGQVRWVHLGPNTRHILDAPLMVLAFALQSSRVQGGFQVQVEPAYPADGPLLLPVLLWWLMAWLSPSAMMKKSDPNPSNIWINPSTNSVGYNADKKIPSMSISISSEPGSYSQVPNISNVTIIYISRKGTPLRPY